MDSVLVDVGLGLAITYLVFSLSVTSLSEAISSVSKLRARNLREKVVEVFGQEDGKDLFGDPLLKSLSSKALPSYIPPRLFGEAIRKKLGGAVDAAASLRTEFETGTRTYENYIADLKAAVDRSPFPKKEYAVAILERAEGSGAAFIKDVEKRASQHFDDLMERASGRFARRMKALSFALALFVVVAANVDTVRIAQQLIMDDELRVSLAGFALELSETAGDPGAYGDEGFEVSSAAERLLADQAVALLPIGWNCPNTNAAAELINAACGWPGLRGALWISFGWALSTLAIALGAPFWFGVIQRVANIRGAGGVPKSTAEEQASNA